MTAQSRRRLRLLVLVLSVTFPSGILNNASAAKIDMDVIPFLRLEQGWTSNVFNTSTDKISDFYFRARPELALQLNLPSVAENAPGVGLRLGAFLEGTWYYQNPEANQDPTWFFTLGLSGRESVRLQLTPTLSVVPSVYYINTVDSTRRSQLLPSGDPVVPPVTISTYENTKSQDFGGGLALSYQATPTLSFGLGGNYGERRFQGNTAGLKDSATFGVGTSLSYLITQNTSVGLGVMGSHQAYEDSPDSDILSVGFLFNHQFSPEFTLGGVLAYSYIRQAAVPPLPEQKTSDPAGGLNASYFAGTFRGRTGLTVNYSGGGGYGQATRQGTVYLNLEDLFARGWSWNVGGNYQISRSVFVSNAVNITSAYGSAGINYAPWEWLAFSLSGNINRQWSDGQFGDPGDTYSGALMITMGKSIAPFGSIPIY